MVKVWFDSLNQYKTLKDAIDGNDQFTVQKIMFKINKQGNL